MNNSDITFIDFIDEMVLMDDAGESYDTVEYKGLAYLKASDIGKIANRIHNKRVKALEVEIETLRQYGNKDCTAMADELLKALQGDK